MDGIHWTLENNFANYEICDISRFFWDNLTERAILYGRTKLTPEKNDGRWANWGWGRAVTRIESNDFRSWSGDKNVVTLAADSQDPEGAEIYSLSAFDYEEIPGYKTTVRGADGIEIPVLFEQGTLKGLDGKGVRIRFYLANAQLYGFRVK